MNESIFFFIIFGFIAQMIDGTLGMAYGVSANTLLLTFGLSPMVASACVHTSEIFTTLASGISHFKFGNVDKKLFFSLLIPGVIGGASGAYILTEFPGDRIKPFVSAYLLLMGIRIIWKAFRKAKSQEVKKIRAVPLGLVGGFFDAIGGGGWGPIVTTTLVANGNHPRFVIGSVNAAEFFVTVAESITFFVTIGSLLTQYWQVIVGLLVGGVLAAPLAAYACKRISPKKLMVVVGILIVLLSLRTIIKAF
ncbi:MAG: sulfite exporter TauE/SafE family protein [Patescibacteria group bacterium]|nr:sulfite exporter TauE/SafE family protein [Patescibacteria group bacterium]MDD5295209.1 sulfite exporter TauE/SafE family protein [Patescibacteria group bacterium]MDD5554626.1 sulfite exporter TauE/SafE family protein [Patescibacteria group bacterium]